MHPNQMSISGVVALYEALHSEAYHIAKPYIDKIPVSDDDTRFESRGASGGAVALFAHLRGIDCEAALAELEAFLGANPDLANDFRPKIQDEGLTLDPKAPFPMDALPASIADLCTALADVHEVPCELPGLMALGAISASLGKALTMPSFGGLSVMPNLYTAAGLPPSVGKSVLAKYIFEPLHRHQRALLDQHTLKVAGTKARLAKVEAMLLKEEEDKAEAVAPVPVNNPSVDLAKEKESLERALVTPRFLIEDATVEVMAVRLRENGEYLASVSADAKSAITNLVGRYSKGGSEDDIYLKAFSGDPFYQDRIGRASVSLANPRLVIMWLTQHRFFNEVFASQALEDSGFACRFLALRVEPVSGLEENETIVPESLVNSYNAGLDALLRTYVRHQGQAHHLQADPAATRVLQSFKSAVKKYMNQWELSDELLGYPKRWAEIACKLALVLHAASHGSEAHCHPVSEHSAKNAVRLMTWFAAQQEVLLGEYASTKERPKFGKALEMVEHSPVGITARDLARKYSIFADAKEAARILDDLVSEGRIQSYRARKSRVYQRLPRPGGKP